jgi:hypothetical protein
MVVTVEMPWIRSGVFVVPEKPWIVARLFPLLLTNNIQHL